MVILPFDNASFEIVINFQYIIVIIFVCYLCGGGKRNIDSFFLHLHTFLCHPHTKYENTILSFFFHPLEFKK